MILVNGTVTSTIAVTDRGLAYGDGLFETMAVAAGAIPHWPRHLRRLEEGCTRLRIPVPARDTLEREIATVIAGESPAVLKLTLTRGSGRRGYGPPPDARPTRILQRLPWPALDRTPARVGLCATRLGRNAALAGIKHLNRLEQVLGAAELEGLGVDEGLMRDDLNRVIAGTRTNVFVIRGRTLLTPELTECGIAGIMRGLVLEHAAACGLEARTAALRIADLETADELFLTNALAGIWPVASLTTGTTIRGFESRALTAALCDRFAALGLTP